MIRLCTPITSRSSSYTLRSTTIITNLIAFLTNFSLYRPYSSYLHWIQSWLICGSEVGFATGRYTDLMLAIQVLMGLMGTHIVDNCLLWHGFSTLHIVPHSLGVLLVFFMRAPFLFAWLILCKLWIAFMPCERDKTHRAGGIFSGFRGHHRSASLLSGVDNSCSLCSNLSTMDRGPSIPIIVAEDKVTSTDPSLSSVSIHHNPEVGDASNLKARLPPPTEVHG